MPEGCSGDLLSVAIMGGYETWYRIYERILIGLTKSFSIRVCGLAVPEAESS